MRMMQFCNYKGAPCVMCHGDYFKSCANFHFHFLAVVVKILQKIVGKEKETMKSCTSDQMNDITGS